jgi:hypothetical protein
MNVCTKLMELVATKFTLPEIGFVTKHWLIHISDFRASKSQ